MTFFQREYEWLAFGGSLIAFIIAFYVAFLLFKRNREKKTIILKLVTLMVLFLGLAAFSDFITFTINRLNIIPPEISERIRITTLGTALGFSFNALANIFLLEFDESVFHSENPIGWKIPYFIAEGMIIVMLMIFVFAHLDILYLSLIHVFLCFILYIKLSFDANFLRKKLLRENQHLIAEIKALKMIVISGIVLFFAIFFFVLHEVFIMVEYREFWTVALGWILGSIGGYYLYIGYVIPDWIREKWENKK